MIFLKTALVLLTISGVASFGAAAHQWVLASGIQGDDRIRDDRIGMSIAATIAGGVFIGIVVIVGGIMAIAGS